MSELLQVIGDEHLSLDEHFGCVHSKLTALFDTSLFRLGQILMGLLGKVQTLGQHAGDLGLVVADGFK